MPRLRRMRHPRDRATRGIVLLEAYAEAVRTILTTFFNPLVDPELNLPAAPSLGTGAR